MNEPEVNMIQVNNMPDLDNLEPNAIYFVRNEEIIIQTNSLKQPKFFGLKKSYQGADTPLNGDDKLLVRQGNTWKEVDKSEIGSSGGASNQVFGYEFSYGNFYMISGYYMVSHKDVGVTSTAMSKIVAESDTVALSHGYTKGKIVEKDGVKIKKLVGYVRIGYNANIRIVIGRKHYLSDGSLQVQVIASIPYILTNGSKWNIDINSDIQFVQGDEIVLMIDARNLSGNKKAFQLYNKIIAV